MRERSAEEPESKGQRLKQKQRGRVMSARSHEDTSALLGATNHTPHSPDNYNLNM